MSKKMDEITIKEEGTCMEREQSEETTQNQSGRKTKIFKRILVITIPIIIFCVAFIIVFNMTILPSVRYKKALSLIDERKFDKAFAMLEELGDYKDCNKILDKFVFVLAKEDYTDSGNSSTTKCEYTYDDKGNCVKEVSVFSVGGQSSIEYSYDANGNCLKKVEIDSEGEEKITEYSYDEAGNCIKKVDNGRTTEYSYDEAEKLIKKDDGFSTTVYSYDSEGNCVKEERSYLALGKPATETTEYSYDNNGNCLEEVMTYPGGDQIITEYSYNEDGKCIKEDVKSLAGNTEKIRYFYDGKGNLIRREYEGYGEQQTFEYSYDDYGNCVKQVFSTLKNGKSSKSTWRYTYKAYYPKGN